jgi:2-phospho-L-lactate guanylyltransferase
MTIQVLIPLKRLASAKQRLSPAVSPASRRRVMLHMLRGAIDAAREADVGPVALVTSEPTAPRLAAEHHIRLLSDDDLSWNEGLLHALRSIDPAPAAVLYLSGDLPMVSAADISRFVNGAPEHGVAIARARDGGTNALLVRPAAAITPMFGHQPSAARHAHQAVGQGFPALVVDIPGLALDVDTLEDLRAARSARRSQARRQKSVRWGVIARLAGGGYRSPTGAPRPRELDLES